MAVVPHRLVSCGVLGVGPLAGDLSPHLGEEHADAWVALDEILELLQDGHELRWVLVNVVDLRLEPISLDAGVYWDPASGPESR